MEFNFFQIRRRRRRGRLHNGIGSISKFFGKVIVPIDKHKRRFQFQQKRRKSKLREEDVNQDTYAINRIDPTVTESRRNNSNDSDENNYNDNSNNVAEVGSLPKRLLRKKETMTFMVHGFAECDKKRGQYCLSPPLKAHGYTWRLQLYPRGNDHSDETTEQLSCFLHYFANRKDTRAPMAKAEYICGSYRTETQICDFAIERGKRSCCWGLENFVQRDRVIRNCLTRDGTLCIQVNLQIAIDRRKVWYPQKMRQEPTLLQLYHSIEETGDVTFRLTSNKTGYHQYYKAHKMILALRARILYELICEETLPEDEDENFDDTAVDLPGVDQDDFEAMLKHIYTLQQPTITNEETAKKLLVAADRFCLTDLKMYVESVLVDRFTTSDNAASLLLFADAHSCALLKEKTMDLYADDPSSIVRSVSWPLVEESEKLLVELSTHQTSAQHFDVFSLREQLGEGGLAVDGSREVLLGRLREARRNNNC